MENIGAVVVLLIATVYLLSGLRIAKEHERFAITVMGRFLKLRGPGLALRWPGAAAVWEKIRIGHEGEYLGDGLATFGATSVPVEAVNIKEGNRVRISSFRDGKVWVSDKGTVTTVTCAKCGHKMRI